MLPIVSAMRVSRRLKPFDSSDYVYELKHDGFRALAYVESGQCRLVSRNGNRFRNYGTWLNGENLRGLPLVERKARLRKLIGRRKTAILYVDHIEHQERAVFEQACRLDLESIVAKPKRAPYVAEVKKSPWVKIKSATYSQKERR